MSKTDSVIIRIAKAICQFIGSNHFHDKATCRCDNCGGMC